MSRWTMRLTVLTGLFLSLVSPSHGASGLIFEGKVAARDGRPVAGAEIQILDAAGKLQDHIFSDLHGFYRFPAMPAPADNSKAYRMELSLSASKQAPEGRKDNSCTSAR